MPTNTKNRYFYEDSPLNYLNDEFITKAGLLSNSDMNIVFRYIKKHKNKTVLEVGAGLGRVLEFLLKMKYDGDIVAIDYCKQYASYLEEKYASIKNIKIINDNIFNCFHYVDFSLLMFSVLLDYDAEEQKRLIKHLTSITNNAIFIDLPECISQSNMTHQEGQCVSISTNWAISSGYFPSKAEILDSFIGSNFVLAKEARYKTQNQRKRILYIFEKLPLPAS